MHENINEALVNRLDLRSRPHLSDYIPLQIAPLNHMVEICSAREVGGEDGDSVVLLDCGSTISNHPICVWSYLIKYDEEGLFSLFGGLDRGQHGVNIFQGQNRLR